MLRVEMMGWNQDFPKDLSFDCDLASWMGLGCGFLKDSSLGYNLAHWTGLSRDFLRDLSSGYDWEFMPQNEGGTTAGVI